MNIRLLYFVIFLFMGGGELLGPRGEVKANAVYVTTRTKGGSATPEMVAQFQRGRQSTYRPGSSRGLESIPLHTFDNRSDSLDLPSQASLCQKSTTGQDTWMDKAAIKELREKGKIKLSIDCTKTCKVTVNLFNYKKDEPGCNQIPSLQANVVNGNIFFGLKSEASIKQCIDLDSEDGIEGEPVHFEIALPRTSVHEIYNNVFLVERAQSAISTTTSTPPCNISYSAFSSTYGSLYHRVLQSCQTKHIGSFINALKAVESSTGNFHLLNNTLHSGLIESLTQEGSEYQNTLNRLESILGQSKDDISRSDVRKAAQLAKKISDEFLDPMGLYLQTLRELYETTYDENEKEKILEKITSLSEILQEASTGIFSRGNFHNIYGAIRDDESLHSKAVALENMRAKFSFYQRINPDHPKDVELESARSKAKKSVRIFRKRSLGKWRCHAQSLGGNRACLIRVQKKAKKIRESFPRRMQRFQQRLRERYRRQYARKCTTIFSQKQAMQCQQLQAKLSQRYQRRLLKKFNKFKKKQSRLMNRARGYQMNLYRYRRQRALEREESGGFGDGYSVFGFEDEGHSFGDDMDFFDGDLDSDFL